MSRSKKLLGGVCAVAVIAAFGAASAYAGASPAVSTGPATTIKDMSATLTGTVNPNGSATTYYFQYGLTSTYSVATKQKSAGGGVKAIAASSAIAGLTPGTTYHYRLVAINKSGATSLGSDRSFTTAGHPPAAATTGFATAIGKSVVTLTGTVNPNGQDTNWTFQYGPTTAYGSSTFGGTLQAASTPSTVTSTIAGLEPGTTFHYRLVALHGTSVISAGLDQTFFTEPNPTPTPKVKAHTSPGHAKQKPYTFTTKGSIHGPGYIPATSACTGNAFVQFFLGTREVALTAAAIQPNCTFAATTTFNRIPGKHHRGTQQLRVITRFGGNGYLTAKTSSTQTVSIG